MFSGLRRFLPAVLLLPLIFAAACRGQEKFSFDFLSDTHTSPAGAPVEGFAATCEHLLQAGPGDFLILGGDYDNFGRTREVIERILVKPLAEKGRKYPFYVAVGNHDVVNASNDKKDDDGTGLQTQAIIAHGRQLPGIVRRGPASRSKLAGYGRDGAQYTTYSFDHGNAHFIILDLYSENSYPNRGNAVMSRALLDWVKDDLAGTDKKHIFVVGHRPCLSYTEQRGGRKSEVPPGHLIEQGEREAFWNLLKGDARVVAYLSGHSHRFGMKQDGTLWQIGAARARDNWKTHLSFTIDGDRVSCRAFREENGRYVEYDQPLRPLLTQTQPSETAVPRP